MKRERVVIEASGVAKTYVLWRSSSARLWLPIVDRAYRWIPLQRLGFGEGKQVRKRLCERFTALHRLNLNVYEGECLGIIGRNGSGKSTLLQIISGILAPTEGKAETRGRLAALLELGSGFNHEFTGKENVYLNAAIYGLGRKEVESLMPRIEAFAEIGDFIDQKVKTYSSGMVVRLAFSVLVHLDPDILIIDEALAVGDSFFVQKCMRWMGEFKKTKTVILVSHDLSAITRFCDRVLWLDNGRARYLGNPRRATELYLESHYEETHGKEDDAAEGDAEKRPSDRPESDVEDFRQEEFRSDPDHTLPIAVCFRESTSFGKGRIRITDVALREVGEDTPKRLVRGGERVRVEILIEAVEAISSPIVGFGLKNRLGQELFHDNTYLTSYLSDQPPLDMEAGSRARAAFEFTMPYLPPGDYFLFAAVASGTHEEHDQEHWIHEAVKLTSACERICLGLVGLPMQNIEFHKED